MEKDIFLIFKRKKGDDWELFNTQGPEDRRTCESIKQIMESKHPDWKFKFLVITATQ